MLVQAYLEAKAGLRYLFIAVQVYMQGCVITEIEVFDYSLSGGYKTRAHI